MKKLIFAASVLLLIGAAQELNAQNCRLVADSVIAGMDSSAVRTYVYDAQDQLVRINHVDSNGVGLSSWYSISYSNGLMTQVQHFPMDTSTSPEEEFMLAYDNNNRVTTYTEYNHEYGDTIVYDVTYNSSNEMVSLIHDPSLSNVYPEINIIDITWNNGNPVSFSFLVHDGATTDTFEVAATFDDKHNVYRFDPTDVVSTAMVSGNQNNLMSLTLINDESIGQAGTKLFDRSYTYNADDEVETMTNSVALFDEGNYTMAFEYNCPTVGLKDDRAPEVSLYPNPTSDVVTIATKEELPVVKLTDIQGRTVHLEKNFKNGPLDVSELTEGLYLLYGIDENGNTVFQKRLIISN